MTKAPRIVTHNAGFHADDVFGVATLMLLLGKDAVEIIRSRDQEIIDTGDYVLDVGGVYDPEKNRFDHHQREGAGQRENGVPYGAFGLIWKKFGLELCGSENAAKDIDERLVSPIDAHDNGIDTHRNLVSGTHPYTISLAMFPFQPLTKNDLTEYDRCFVEAVEWVLPLLRREVLFAQKRIKVFEKVDEVYEKTNRRDILLIDEPGEYNREIIVERLEKYPEVIYFVREYATGVWQIACAADDIRSYKNRKDLPEAWRGKHDEELAEVTGVADALFCHRTGFMAVARSKEGALKLAELALTAAST